MVRTETKRGKKAARGKNSSSAVEAGDSQLVQVIMQKLRRAETEFELLLKEKLEGLPIQEQVFPKQK